MSVGEGVARYVPYIPLKCVAGGHAGPPLRGYWCCRMVCWVWGYGDIGVGEQWGTKLYIGVWMGEKGVCETMGMDV